MFNLFKSIKDKIYLINLRLVIRKPLLILRILFRYVFYFAYKNKFRSVMLALHYDCNLSCSHCYEKKFNNTDKKQLNFDDKKQLIKECLELDILSFDFIGGESHLFRNFEDLIKICKPKTHYITLATNGYNFSETKIKMFLNLGIDKFNISIDSWYEEEHDKFRGVQGAYTSVFQTLNLCRKIGMDVTVTITVQKDFTQKDGFKKLVEYMIKNRIRTNLKLAIPMGNWEANKNILVTKEDVEIIDRLHKDYPFLTRDIYGNEKMLCPAFDDFFTITAYGDVMPCNAIHVGFGNVREQKLKDILISAKKNQFIPKKKKQCPVSENTEFINKILKNIEDKNNYPPHINSFREKNYDNY